MKKKIAIIDTPLVLLILFFVFLYALVFSIRSVVTPLKQEISDFKTETETEMKEVVKNGKIYKIIERY